MLAGKDGDLKMGTNKVTLIDNFSLAINNGITETNSVGSSWKEYMETVKDWSGSGSGTMHYADQAQKSIVDGIISGVTAKMDGSFKCDIGLIISGEIIISSMSITSQFADKVAVSFNFVGNGAPKLGTGVNA